MEKYSRFNDARSGVNPFAQQPYRPGAATLIVGLLWVAIKAPFIGLFGGLLLGLSEVARLLPVPAFARLLSVTALQPLARIVLMLFGFYGTPESQVNKHSVRVRPSRSSPSSVVKNGDILLVNKCSYIDVLYLMSRYAPTFTVTTQEGGLRELSFLEALKASVTGVRAKWPSSSAGVSAEESVDKVLRRNLGSSFRGPLVVFPEGAPTNNKAVLMFSPVIDQIERCVITIARGHGDAGKLQVPTVHVVALRYGVGSAGFPPYYTSGNPLLHSYFVCAQGSNSLAVARLPDNYEPQPADFIAPATGAVAAAGSATGVAATSADALQSRKAGDASPAAGAAAADDATGVSAQTSWPFAVRDALTQLIGRGCKAVALGAAHYDEFLAVYREAIAANSNSGAGASKARR